MSPPASLANRLGVAPIYWREAALCVPAMPAMMAAGLLTGAVATAAIAAGAAFSVGFGAARELRGHRWGAMWAASAAMALATFIGSLTAGVLAEPTAGIAAAACAALALYDEDLWWIALQAVVALFVAQYYPGTLAEAGERAGIVFAGGVAQIGCVLILRHAIPRAAAPLPAGAAPEPPTRRSLAMHMLRAAACVAGALWLARHYALANSYWAPMTAMLVLKPGLRDTATRGVQRVAGTLAGCLAATALVIATGGQPILLVVLLGLAAGTAFATQKSNYAVLSFAITATVVMLVTLARGDVVLSVEHRIEATLLGGGAALLAAWIAPRRPPWARKLVDRVGNAAAVGRGR